MSNPFGRPGLSMTEFLHYLSTHQHYYNFCTLSASRWLCLTGGIPKYVINAQLQTTEPDFPDGKRFLCRLWWLGSTFVLLYCKYDRHGSVVLCMIFTAGIYADSFLISPTISDVSTSNDSNLPMSTQRLANPSSCQSSIQPTTTPPDCIRRQRPLTTKRSVHSYVTTMSRSI
eukprot:scaffold23239_cov17-Prasinocladus_malaysianus.AAC.2